MFHTFFQLLRLSEFLDVVANVFAPVREVFIQFWEDFFTLFLVFLGSVDNI